MDKQFDMDMKMTKKITNYNRIANNMYSRSEMISKSIRSDASVLLDLKSNVTDLRHTLDNLLCSDTIIAADAFGAKLSTESKWDDRLKSMHLDMEAKTGRSIGALKKDYRVL